MSAGRGRAARAALGLVVALASALALVGLVALAGCGGSAGGAGPSASPAPTQHSGAAAKVTFVELGSDSCVPCKEMRPVMAGAEFQRHTGFYPQEDIEALLVERGLEKIATP